MIGSIDVQKSIGVTQDAVGVSHQEILNTQHALGVSHREIVNAHQAVEAGRQEIVRIIVDKHQEIVGASTF